MSSRVMYESPEGALYEAEEVKLAQDSSTGDIEVRPLNGLWNWRLRAVEVETCALCGDDYKVDVEGSNDICNDCFTERLTLKEAWEYGERNKETVKLNGLLAWVLSARQIEDAIMRVITLTLKDAQKFCNEDAMHFADYLKEKYV